MTKSKRGKNKSKKSTSKQDIDLKEDVPGCDDADLFREQSNAGVQEDIPGPDVSSNEDTGKRMQTQIKVILLNPEKQKAEQTLETPEQRNDWIRSNPEFLLKHIAKIYERRLSQCQVSEIAGCEVSWCRAFLPFHLTFSFSIENACCYHLLSVRNSRADDPELYAKELLPLATRFLAQEKDSESPHLPFIKATAEGKDNAICEIDHEIQERSLLHAQHILAKHDSLLEMSLETSEDTARLINQRKISWTLVRLLTSPSKNKVPDDKAEISLGLDRKSVTSPEPNHKADTPEPDPKTPALLELYHKDKSSELDCVSATSPKRDHKAATSAKPDHDTKHEPFNPSSGHDVSFTQVADCAKGNGEAMTQANHTLQEPAGTESVQSAHAHPKIKTKKKKAKKLQQGSNVLQSRTSAQPASQQVSCSTDPPVVQSTTGPVMSASSYPNMHEGQATQIHHVAKSEASDNRRSEALLDYLICQGVSDPALAELASHIKARKEELRQLLTALGEPEESAGVETNSTCRKGSKSAIDSSGMPVGWAYATHTDADRIFEEAGVWLWEKPNTYFLPQELPCAVISDCYKLMPVQISQKHTAAFEPAIFFDGNSVEIVPHTEPWPDIRSNFDHPDFVPPIRLAEMQACEIAGYQTWRQDRDYGTCRKEECGRLLYDPDPSVVVCQGCGPFAGIRYCSIEHQIADMDNHRDECGSYDLIIEMIPHKAATPLRFTQVCPMIPTSNGFESYEFYRQKSMTARFNGRYTIFKPLIPTSTTLSWPTTSGLEAAEELNRRIERLLNATFFGYRSHRVMKYLYCTLRALITAAAPTTYPPDTHLPALTTQFAQEFGHDFSYIDRQRICECEWHGVAFRGRHVDDCPWSGPDDGRFFGETVGEGVRSELVRLEARYWILRAWQQQHPVETDWKRRAQGWGFAGALSGTDVQLLGPGFEGWGAAESNIYD